MTEIFGDILDQVKGQPMAMKIVYEKTKTAVISQPLQHANDLLIGKMMAEQGRKYYICRLVSQIYFGVIAADPITRQFRVIFACISDAFRVQVDADETNRNVSLSEIPVDRHKVIAS